jgi:hypothetical protein
MRRPRHSVTHHHLSLALRNGALSRVGKKNYFDYFFSFLGISARSSLLDCCVLFPLHVRQGTEAQHRAPSSFFGSEKWHPLPSTKEKTILIVVSFFLSLLGYGTHPPEASKKARAALRCVIVWFCGLSFVIARA